MKAYFQLTLAQLKLFARNKTVIFWTTLFPLFLMIMLGTFLGSGGQSTVSLAWIDYDHSLESNQVMQKFKENEAVELLEMDSVDEAVEQIQQGDLLMALFVPKGFSQDMKQEKAYIDIYYDEVNQSSAQLGFAVISQMIDEVNKELVHFTERVHIEEKGVQSLQLTYLDFLVPGIVALMILSSNMNGVAAQIASWRERGILRRLRSTGLAASTFIAAQITARMALNLTQACLVLLVGIFLLGAQMNGAWLLLLFYLILGILVFMSIGFIIASLAKTPEHAAPVAGFLSFPMFFLGGIFFPVANMPAFLQPLVYLIPITHLTDVLRQVMNVGATMLDLWLPTVVLSLWFIFSFAVAARFFKWEY